MRTSKTQIAMDSVAPQESVGDAEGATHPVSEPFGTPVTKVGLRGTKESDSEGIIQV